MSRDRIDVSGLSKGTRAYLRMNPIGQILRDKGLNAAGKAQAFHTQNVLKRIIKYMPFRTGATIKVTIAQTDINKPRIVTDVPYAKYLFYGKAMTGRAPRKATSRPLKYTRTKNPQAGPRWDRALSTAEGAAMAADLQRYLERPR